MTDMNKTLEDYFTDWEASTFGYGYGSGELYIIQALKVFLAACPSEGTYDYKVFEKELGPTVTWLLINILCKTDIIEYGSSPRFAWLSKTGKRLKYFVDARTAVELNELTGRCGDYIHCYPDACNCGSGGYDAKKVCQNPFWLNSAKYETKGG